MTQIGHVIGNYRILGELGQGGMGAVYHAIHVTQGHHVALKVLTPLLANNDDFSNRFLRETEVMRRLRHPYIVQLYEAGRAVGILYIAMELLEGGSLADRLSKGRPLDLSIAVLGLSQVASALDYAHCQGVVHRDVKPSNILFARDGRAVVGDFGIAALAGASRLTQTGAAIGTPEYTSPEQARGLAQPDGRADIYSLGVVAYQMFTGRLPFERENSWAVLLAHLNEPPPPLQRWNPTVSLAVQTAVLRALEKSPDRRYATMGQFAHAVAAAAGATNSVPPLVYPHPRTPTPRPDTAPSHTGKGIWPVAGLAIFALVAAVLLAISGSSDTRQMASLPVIGPLIAFEADKDGNKEIYATDLTGQPSWRLTNHPAMDWGPSWSPDGSRLAFVSDREGATTINVMNRHGQDLRRLMQGVAQDSGPVWSPDGRQIAFDSNRSGNLDIYVINTDGTGMVPLTRHPANDGDPAWSPDGNQIVFESDRDGNFEIYAMRADGAGVRRLTTASGRDFAPVWAPDGKRIVFECQRDGEEICIMNADGSQSRRLTTDAYRDLQPNWSPDGRQIIWTRQNPVTGVWSLYVMDSDGQDIRPLRVMPWSETAPAWVKQ
jgi:serine/threonine protein kinase